MSAARTRPRSTASSCLERMPDFEIAQQAHVARTFQNIRLFRGMTVLENLIVAQHNRLMHASGWSLLGLVGAASYREAERAAVERARFWLDRIGLLSRADDAAGDLPYGDQRRLEIARAMCTDPVLLCLDEPAAGLNPKETAALNGLLRAIRDEHSTSILLIEHDMSVVMEISDHVIVHRVRADASPTGRPTACATIPRSLPPTSASRTTKSRARKRRPGYDRAYDRAAARTAGRHRLPRQHRRAARHRHRGAEGRDRDPHRRQRRRQVHAHDDDLRQPARAPGPHRVRRAGHHRSCPRTRLRGSASRSRRRGAASSRA